MGRVRAHVVVVDPPALDDDADLGQGAEDRLVQALVAELAVEAFDEAVLLRLARRDVAPVDADAVGPFEHRPAGHLGSVVADDGVRLATPGNQDVQLAGHAMAADRGVDDQGQGLAGEVVDDAQNVEAPAPAEAVGDEVQAPALSRSVRQGHRRARPGGPLTSAPAAHRQTLLAVEPEELLLVHADAFTLEQNARPPMAETASLSRQRPQPLARFAVARIRRAAHRFGIDLDQPAGPLLEQAALRHQTKHGRPARCRPDQFFPEDPSAPTRPASTPPRASSAAGSRPPAPSASGRPTRLCRCTSPSTDRRSAR